MCGIFCSIHRDAFTTPNVATQKLLQNRGPDSVGQHQVLIDAASQPARQLRATFLSTVLSLRGKTVVTQPLQHEQTGAVLCWNGEAWSIGNDAVAGNDSQLIFDKLVAVSSTANSLEASIRAVTMLMSSVSGPYAFVFYDATHKLVYYGRDCLGRRSLLQKSAVDGAIVLSSVCDNASGDSWTEVEADGIHVVDLSSLCSSQSSHSIRHVPHRLVGEVEEKGVSFVGKSLTVQSLLIRIDRAVSSYEP
jgi:asparagine synthetase B (glutamine-hydrolysing)